MVVAEVATEATGALRTVAAPPTSTTEVVEEEDSDFPHLRLAIIRRSASGEERLYTVEE